MDIESLVQTQREWFYEGHTAHINWRKTQLKRLRDVVFEHEQAIFQALKTDLNKSEAESFTTELVLLYEEIGLMLKKLERFAKPKRVKGTLMLTGTASYVVPEPYGVVAIVAPWNYPVQLALVPLVGAIAAGNTAIVKPSELTPNVSKVIKKIIEESFTTNFVACVEGEADVASALTGSSVDYVFFTGSVPVGKKVMRACAEHLTPHTLELGGKSPAIVLNDADITLAAERIAWGKFLNAGQTCVAPDYVLVPRELHDSFVEALKEMTAKLFPFNEHMNSIVSERHWQRLVNFLNDGTIAYGGEHEESKRRIAPSILTNVSLDAPIMQEEIFGPLLPILTYNDEKEAIAYIRSQPKALAAYVFTRNTKRGRAIFNQFSFGGGCVNDTIQHLLNPRLPFGGVGPSGVGAYHGEFSFQTFSHMKSIVEGSTFRYSPRYMFTPSGKQVLDERLKKALRGRS
ncbi:MAG: aldehyde dehydrogenase [Bacilli bacterium]